MQIRYLGFDQRENSRVHRLDVRTDGRMTRQLSITTDIALFRIRAVGIQEDPILCRTRRRLQGLTPAGPSAGRKTTEPALAQLGNVMVSSAFCRR